MKPIRHHVFAYGILAFPEVVQALTGRRFASRKATLRGYRRYALEVPGFLPIAGIVADEHSHVRAVLLRNVDTRSLAIFDAFEEIRNGLYRRESVSVGCAMGHGYPAEVYIAGPAAQNRLAGDWNPNAFKRKYLKRYLNHNIPRFLARSGISSPSPQ